MTAELVLSALLFCMGFTVPITTAINIAILIVASSFLLQFLDDADKLNGYGKYKNNKNNKSDS